MSAITGSLVRFRPLRLFKARGPVEASLAQSVERKALNLVVVGSSPTGGGFLQSCKMREPGIEPGPTPWQGAILPLDHSRLQSPCSLMDKALAS